VGHWAGFRPFEQGQEVMAKGNRVIITCECKECKERNDSATKNKRTTPDKLELSKFCSRCHKHTLHRETK